MAVLAAVGGFVFWRWRRGGRPHGVVASVAAVDEGGDEAAPRSHDGLVGRTPAMQFLFHQIHGFARGDATVLVTGEPGTGKARVARAIHLASRRADRPFIVVDAAGLEESFLASRLLGHCRGAFAGAVADRAGVFEAAGGGTVLLTAIEQAPASVQAGLLRVLRDREVVRLGETVARPVDVRLVMATQHDLAHAVADGRLHPDFVYGVRLATIAVPTLRARIDDVPLLVTEFLAEEARNAGGRAPVVSRDVLDRLRRHRWPGNVRELRQVVQQMLERSGGEVVDVAHLPAELQVEALRIGESGDRGIGR